MRIVYVAGWLRSGTTLLTQMLGSLPGVMALGEVSGVWGAAAAGEACSCGEVILECPVWEPAFSAVTAAHGIRLQDLNEFSRLTRSVLRTRQSHRLAALRRISPDQWPADVQTYVRVLETLLGAVAKETGSEVMVDSSKLPPGFLSLGLIAGTKVDVVQIIRDPRAVANSELRSLTALNNGALPPVPGRSLLKSTLYWSLGNLAVRRFGRLADSFTTLRYEQLSLVPEHELLALSRRLGLCDAVPGAPLKAGHLAVGNPSRFDDPSRVIRPDLAWKSELSTTQRALVAAVSAPTRAILHRDKVGGRDGSR